MKSLLLLLALPVAAHASWFEYEAGIGMAQYETEDGRWWQQDVSHSVRSRAPAFSAGLTVRRDCATECEYCRDMAALLADRGS